MFSQVSPVHVKPLLNLTLAAQPASAMSAVQTVYRELLRLGRKLDRRPLSKAMLIAQPDVFFDRRSRELVRLPVRGGPQGEWAQRLAAFNRGEFYAPTKSVREAIKEARHAPPAADPVDVGLAALRTLGVAAAGGEALEQHAVDRGRELATLPISLRLATDVKVGNLLLAHPVACLSQPTLHHSVILLVAVDDDMVTGVIVNKPLQINLGDAVVDSMRELLGPQL
eukprot:3844260-Prymnesium_polylepis.1